jgi:hypothetical protein
MAFPSRHRPFVLEPLEQLAAAQLEGNPRLGLSEPLELDRVDRCVHEPHAVAVDLDGLSQLALQRPQSAAQAGASALVEHVGPESRGELGPRDRAVRQREVREQRPRALGRRQIDPSPVQLDLQRAKQACAQHGISLTVD